MDQPPDTQEPFENSAAATGRAPSRIDPFIVGLIAIAAIGALVGWRLWSGSATQSAAPTAAPSAPQTATETQLLPRIVEFGTLADKILVVVEGMQVTDQEFRKQFGVMVIVRARDVSVDANQDTVIDKSEVIPIPEGEEELQIPLSKPSMRRLLTNGTVEAYVVCVPNSLTAPDIRSLEDARSKRAMLCDQRSFAGPRVQEVP